MAGEHDDAERRLRRLAWLLDNSISLPGDVRIGLDPLIGLVPGIGDLIGVALSSYIIAVAAKLGAPRSLLLRMGLNVGVEAIVGAVPLLGDVFDAYWKANYRNVGLLEDYLASPSRVRRESMLTVILVLAAIAAIVIGCIVLVFLSLRWLITSLA
jgi:hypothetical protein